MSGDDLERAVDRLEETYDFFSYDECLNPARADWTLLGNFYDQTVLVAGCGFSPLSLSLAQVAKHVTLVDVASEPVAFISEIARIRGITNLTATHADLVHLPSASGEFDRIVMADVLAHASHIFDTGSPHEQQTRVLGELRERLTSNGELWIATENRLAPKHFVGQVTGQDPPFTPLMPAWAAQRAARLTTHGRVSRHLVTESGLRRMLVKAGFRDLHVFYVVTDYRFPRFISSTARHSVIRTYLGNVRQGAQLKANIGMGILATADRVGLAGTFSPYFIVSASR